MPKYQFFTQSDSDDDSANFTYLDMNSETFFIEKEQLLNSYFEVDGEPILAVNSNEAVIKYRFGLSETIDDYGKSSPMHIVTQLIIDGYSSLLRKNK